MLVASKPQQGTVCGCAADVVQTEARFSSLRRPEDERSGEARTRVLKPPVAVRATPSSSGGLPSIREVANSREDAGSLASLPRLQVASLLCQSESALKDPREIPSARGWPNMHKLPCARSRPSRLLRGLRVLQ